MSLIINLINFKKIRYTVSNLLNYPTRKNIRYFWNLGRGLGIILVVQIITGILLTFYYTPSSNEAFRRSDFVGREVFGGYLLRILHLNGASVYFFCLYLHISRGVFYSRFSQSKTWSSGVIIYLISMGIAFLGYVLPWGQISFWGASVITNLVATIPILGPTLVLWVWGGFNVNNATLSMFFSLHYILPLFISVIILIHIFFLHEYGRTTPQKTHREVAKISFGEYFLTKDMLNIPPLVFFYSLTFFGPWVLGDPENWIPADPIKRPVHIQPEWYFLFAYAILRSVPNKLGGVICLLLRVLVLFLLPAQGDWEPKKGRIHTIVLRFLLVVFISLTWLGGCGVEDPFILVGQIYSIIYFLVFGLFIML